ncbi:hypothetical protein, partial [Anaerolinea sp.]|uniref:hypothetical protein n=1 Tax=Anaerolinea sp. TaxID=1872519 RepID=UPI002ACF024A
RWNDFLNAWNNVPPEGKTPADSIPYYQAIISKPNVSQTRRIPKYNRSNPSIRGRYMPVER